MSTASPRIHCREIGPTDMTAIVDLLTRGFRGSRRAFWVSALERLTEHSTPPGFPKYGYLLECRGSPVGVLLMIFSSIIIDGMPKIRCSMSSWYVDPAFRRHAITLWWHARRYNQVTYTNITPHPRLLGLLEKGGFVRYCEGQFVAVPVLSTGGASSHAKLVASDSQLGDDLPLWESELLLKHAHYGCISVICSSTDCSHPFVFVPRHKHADLPCVHLAYCRHVDDFVRFAEPLGRFLAQREIPLVTLDANGPINGLIGRYSDGRPKYFRGPDRPRLGDIAYSERVMFGF